MVTATQHNNTKSKQNLNRMYFEQTGASTTEEVVRGFGKGWVVFAILSIIASTFSVYMDLVTSTGAIVAFIVALALGTMVEGFRALSIKGVFSGMTFISRVIVGGVAFILMVTALATHYRSLNVYEQLIINDALTAENDKIALQRGLTNDNVKSLVASNLEVSKGINNNYKGDDESIRKIISSNNDLVKTLMVLNGESNRYRTDLVISKSTKLAKKTKNTLFILFVVIEFLAVFSIVSKLLLSLNTDKEVKELVTTMDKLETLKSNVYEAVSSQLIDQTEAEIKQAQIVANYQHQQKIESITNHSPTSNYAGVTNHQNQSNKAQIAFDANSDSNSYFMGTGGVYPLNNDKPSFLPTINKRKPNNSGTRTEINSNENDNLKKNLNNGEKEVLDLMKFEHKENELIKILWENGTVKAGDKLLSKRFVLPQLPRTITERDLVNLYEKLIDYHMVEFKNGYRALVDIENVVKNKSE